MKWFFSLLLLLLTPWSTMAISQQVDEIRSGDSLPNFSVQSNQGKTVSTSLLKGKPAVIVFFHTQCLDCRMELPMLQELYEHYREYCEFICISRGEPKKEVETYWNTHHLTMPWAAQEDKKVFHLFARRTIPRIYISNAEGIIQKVFKEKVRKRRLIRALEKEITQSKK